jgi:signal transduction histidine kinase
LVRSGQVNDAVVQEEFLLHAAQDANRLLDLVDELTDFSSLEGEALELTRESVDVGKMVNDVLTSLREQASARRVTMVASPMEEGLTAEVDVRRIRRVLSKLVENAIRASNKGGKVLVTCKSMNGNLALNVIDEGPGMTLEECERIFDKFFQAEQSEQSDVQGIGLGLYVSQQVVQAHGGVLTMSSQLGAGSTFTLIIPVKKKQ